jgi:hypothetical protein
LDANGPIGHRRALPPGERHLSFGDRWDYAPAPEAHDYIQLKKRYELFIGGKFVRPRSGRYFPSINPATEETLAEIAEGNAKDVHLAVKAATHLAEIFQQAELPDGFSPVIPRAVKVSEVSAAPGTRALGETAALNSY